MSEYIEINGGTALSGVVPVSGAKNAGLPLLISTLLSSEECTLENVPNLTDTSLVLQLLEHFGASVEFHEGTVKVQTEKLTATDASYSLVKALRASFWVLAPLLARGGAARVAMPGGDLIGARLVDIHLDGLSRMGADIKVKHGVVYATAVSGLKPIDFQLHFPSVGATHQLIMAASLTPGLTVLKGCAREPEIVALAQYLNGMGADIQGAGSSVVEIRGKKELGGVSQRLIGDRIEAGTYLLAGAMTGGKVRAVGIDPIFFGDFLNSLYELGLTVTTGENFIEVERKSDLKPVKIVTGPFPQFASDLQPLMMAAVTLCNGTSTIEETIYEGRFGHISELTRMGAKIRMEDKIAIIDGIPNLAGAPVDGLDIRAGAALVIAGLAAEGRTQVFEPQHVRRGYEQMERKIRALSGKFSYKVADPEDFMFTGC